MNRHSKDSSPLPPDGPSGIRELRNLWKRRDSGTSYSLSNGELKETANQEQITNIQFRRQEEVMPGILYSAKSKVIGDLTETLVYS